MTNTTNRIEALRAAAARRVRNLCDCDIRLYTKRATNLRALAFAKARAEVRA